MRTMTLCVMALVTACGALTPPRSDAGSGGGGAVTGGGSAASGGGTGGSAGGGGGTATGGGSAAGGGIATGGGAGEFAFVRMTFSPLPTGPVSSADVVGLARRSEGSLWVALANSSIYVAAPGSQALRLLPNLPTSVSGSTVVVDVAATATEVFILRVGGALRCQGACTSFTDFTPAGTVGGIETAVGLCARDQRAFFLSQQNATTALWELQAGTFVQTVADLGVGRAQNCYLSPAGELMVPGDTVAVISSTGGLTNEAFNLNGHPAASWRAVTTADAGSFAVGGGSGYRFAKRAGNVWSDLTPNTAGALMATIVTAGNDVYAGGYTNTGLTSTPAIYKWNGSAFAALSPQPYAIDVTAALEVSANELYFGGSARTGGGYEVLHGTR